MRESPTEEDHLKTGNGQIQGNDSVVLFLEAIRHMGDMQVTMAQSIDANSKAVSENTSRMTELIMELRHSHVKDDELKEVLETGLKKLDNFPTRDEIKGILGDINTKINEMPQSSFNWVTNKVEKLGSVFGGIAVICMLIYFIYTHLSVTPH